MGTVHVFTGRTIEQRPSLKVFALADILSLASGLMLSSPARLHALVGYVTGSEDFEAAARARDARECLEEQLPFLKTVDYTLLHRAFKNDAAGIGGHIAFWLGAQERLYGAEHAVMPVSRWQRRRNSHKL